MYVFAIHPLQQNELDFDNALDIFHLLVVPYKHGKHTNLMSSYKQSYYGPTHEILVLCLVAQRSHGKKSTVKPVLSGHSKINKTKILMTNCSLMQMEHSAILLACIKR